MKKLPSEVDRHIGNRMRARRVLIGMSQEKLGEALGLTFQQVQKYEKGANRVGAGRLPTIGKILGVSVSYFYEGLPEDDNAKSSSENMIAAALGTPEGLRLAKAFATIDDDMLRRKFVELAEAVAHRHPVS